MPESLQRPAMDERSARIISSSSVIVIIVVIVVVVIVERARAVVRGATLRSLSFVRSLSVVISR